MAVIQQVLCALVIGWLPGAVLFRVPLGNRSRRFTLPPEERIFWQVVISLALALAGVLALAGFGRYEFRSLLVIQSALALIPLALWRGRLRVTESRAIGPFAALPVLLMIGGAMVLLSPSEYVIAGKDPGLTSAKASRSRSAATW